MTKSKAFRPRPTARIGAALLSAGVLTLGSAVVASANPAQEPNVGGEPLTHAESTPSINCESLTDFDFPDTTITQAELVPAGPLEGVEVGEHCWITGTMEERTSAVDGQDYGIGFEVRTPVDWNGRFLYQANGGLDGEVVTALGAPAAGDSALQDGFAVLSSDAGHSGSQTPLFGIDPQARLNYGYQAVGKLTPMAKELIEEAHGRAPARSYIAGGSNGGRHVMVAAARHADLFDGFYAVAPGFNLPKSAVAQLWGAQQYATVATDPNDISTAFTAPERALVGDQIVARCDALDGVEDGMVLNPAACQEHFSIVHDVPTCDSQRDGTCLTSQQKEVIDLIHSGATTDSGEEIYSPFPYDPGLAQGSWAFWEFQASVFLDPVAYAFTFRTPPEAPNILGDLQNYALNIDVDEAMQLIHATNDLYTESAMEFMTPPDATNLDTLRDQGKKMIVAHGLSDAVFSSSDTAHWYENVQERYGGNADHFVRYFEVPGMGHVSGGPATDRLGGLQALVDWVEGDVAPEQLHGTVTADNPELPDSWSPERSRPVCAYPLVPTYVEGDIEKASSFACVSEPGGPVEVTPEDVTFTDEPGTEDDTFTIPEVEGVEYLIDGEVIDAGTHPGEGTVTVTAQAVEGFVLADDATTEWSHEFSSAGEGEPSVPVEVTPEDVTFTDEPGTEDDTFTIPEVEGVEYLIDGEVIDAGTHPGEGTVTVTAQAVEGFVLADDATTEWSHEFSSAGEGEPGDPSDAPPGPSAPEDLPDMGTDVGIYAAIAAVLLVAGISTTLTVRRPRI